MQNFLKDELAGNIGSLGQRAARLLAVKFGGLKKKSVTSSITAEVCASMFGPGLSAPGFESFSKFDAVTLQPFELQTLCYKYGKIQNPSQHITRVQG